jgi:hypothetical protein
MTLNGSAGHVGSVTLTTLPIKTTFAPATASCGVGMWHLALAPYKEQVTNTSIVIVIRYFIETLLNSEARLMLAFSFGAISIEAEGIRLFEKTRYRAVSRKALLGGAAYTRSNQLLFPS